jgi:hypothetical protein
MFSLPNTMFLWWIVFQPEGWPVITDHMTWIGIMQIVFIALVQGLYDEVLFRMRTPRPDSIRLLSA